MIIKKVNVTTLQTMHCSFCHHNPILNLNPKIQARKGLIDMPPNFVGDPKVGPKMIQRKKNRVGACSLICNTLRVKWCVGALGWD
jgi:hypothetical protein